MRPIRFILGALVLMGLLPLRAAAEDIQVTPMSYDYGDVAVGTTKSASFVLESLGPSSLVISEVRVLAEGNDWSSAASTPLPNLLPEGRYITVQVDFSPSIEGQQAAWLFIDSDSLGEENLFIPLTGTGIPATEDPVALMEALLAFVDDAVASGTLTGAGPTPTAADGRLGAFVNMLEATQDLILAGDTAAACEQLTDAYLRVDGSTPPSDFVTGDAAAPLRTLIQALRAALGC